MILISSSLSDLGIVGCKSTAATHFSPFFCPIGGTMGQKNGKNWSHWGRFSLSTPQVRQAARRFFTKDVVWTQANGVQLMLVSVL